jgi:hypothetical protein
VELSLQGHLSMNFKKLGASSVMSRDPLVRQHNVEHYMCSKPEKGYFEAQATEVHSLIGLMRKLIDIGTDAGEPPHKAVVLSTDVFGNKLPNCQLIADSFAEKGGFLVVSVQP